MFRVLGAKVPHATPLLVLVFSVPIVYNDVHIRRGQASRALTAGNLNANRVSVGASISAPL